MPTSQIPTTGATPGVDPDALARNPAYRFASERAQTTSDKHGAHTVELLAVKPAEETSR